MKQYLIHNGKHIKLNSWAFEICKKQTELTNKDKKAHPFEDVFFVFSKMI